MFSEDAAATDGPERASHDANARNNAHREADASFRAPAMNFTPIPLKYRLSSIEHEPRTRNRAGVGMRHAVLGVLLTVASVPPTDCLARTVHAGPDDYRAQVATLQPGDELVLRPGLYRQNLRLAGLHGTKAAPIVIRGTRRNPATVFLARARANTIDIRDSSYLVVRDLVLEGRGLYADGVKCSQRARRSDHITVENLLIRGYGGSQQIVGISTKCPAWNWVVRGNTIIGAGTGMYFGDADGSAPFVGGLIEGNVVIDSLGYNLQIKHQADRSEMPPLPPTQTVVRFNTFAKAHHASQSPLSRPNVLLGHFPATGNGSHDQYLVYGNFFYQNPTERLLQAEGNVSVYNNLFVNGDGDAISIQPHKDVPRRVRIFHNTVLARDAGILVRAAPQTELQEVVANVVFAEEPISGGDQRANVTGPRGRAAAVLNRVGPGLPLDLHPRDRSRLQMPQAYPVTLPFSDCDFDGRKRTVPMAGAYGGAGGDGWSPIPEQAPPVRTCHR